MELFPLYILLLINKRIDFCLFWKSYCSTVNMINHRTYTRHNIVYRALLLQWKSCLIFIRGVDFLEGDNLVVLNYLIASEIITDKRDGIWWKGPYKREMTVLNIAFTDLKQYTHVVHFKCYKYDCVVRFLYVKIVW